MKLKLTATIPKESYNYELSLKAFQFMEAVDQLDQYGLGHVATGLKHSIKHPEKIIRQTIQSNVDEIMHMYTVVYYFSVWENFFNKSETETIFNDWVSSKDAQMFKALKHIRHSAAHSFSGKRANFCRKPFEEVMNSIEAFQGLVWDKQNDTLDLSESQISSDCRNFFSDFSKRVCGRLLNNTPNSVVDKQFL